MNLLRESNIQLREENKHNFEESQVPLGYNIMDDFRPNFLIIISSTLLFSFYSSFPPSQMWVFVISALQGTFTNFKKCLIIETT